MKGKKALTAGVSATSWIHSLLTSPSGIFNNVRLRHQAPWTPGGFTVELGLKLGSIVTMLFLRRQGKASRLVAVCCRAASVVQLLKQLVDTGHEKQTEPSVFNSARWVPQNAVTQG